MDDGIYDDEQGSAGKESSALQKKFLEAVSYLTQNRIGPLDTPAVWAENRLNAHSGNIEQAIDQLVRESIIMSSSTGAVTSAGGLLTMVIGLPANIAGVLAINVRLSAAVAHLRGFNIRDPFLHHFIAIVATGSTIQSAISEVGVKIAQKLTEQMLKKLSVESIRAINKRAGFMLVAKYGTKKATVTLAKGIPIISAVTGGAIDGTGTYMVARAAKKSFLQQNPHVQQ